METSVFLARVLGLFGVISTVSIIIRYKEHLRLERESAESLSSIYSSGYLFLLIGILVVVSHNLWIPDWRITITLFGWMILLKGGMRILFPQLVRNLIGRKQGNWKFLISEITVLVLSCYLLFQGYRN